MIAPLDPSALSAPAQKILGAPPKVQEMTARGIAPGIKPDELVLLLVSFSKSETESIKLTAEKTLSALPDPLLQGALSTNLHALAIDAIALRYPTRMDVLERLFAMPALHPETVEELAKVANEAGAELIATNEERLLANPKIIEYLYLNKHTRMSTADRLIELAVRNNVEVALPAWKEAALAIQNELVFDSGGEPTPDDLLFKESMMVAEQLRQHGDTLEDVLEGEEEDKAKERYIPLHQQIARMTNSQKIRMTHVGTPEALMILIGDPSPIVALAAAKSSLMNEAVAEQVVKRRNISGEAISAIGQKPELLKRLTTKRDLIKNPKTPPSLAMRLITHFQEHELKRLEQDRNVAGSIRALIKNHIERKKR
jgi:hypothetical protein